MTPELKMQKSHAQGISTSPLLQLEKQPYIQSNQKPNLMKLFDNEN